MQRCVINGSHYFLWRCWQSLISRLQTLTRGRIKSYAAEFRVCLFSFAGAIRWETTPADCNLYERFPLSNQVFLPSAGFLQLIGCLGALRLSEKLLNAYWLLLLVLLLGDAILGIFWMFKFDRIMQDLQPMLRWVTSSVVSPEQGFGVELTANIATTRYRTWKDSECQRFSRMTRVARGRIFVFHSLATARLKAKSFE